VMGAGAMEMVGVVRVEGVTGVVVIGVRTDPRPSRRCPNPVSVPLKLWSAYYRYVYMYMYIYCKQQ
jgi:hypothetical protein